MLCLTTQSSLTLKLGTCPSHSLPSSLLLSLATFETAERTKRLQLHAFSSVVCVLESTLALRCMLISKTSKTGIDLSWFNTAIMDMCEQMLFPYSAICVCAAFLLEPHLHYTGIITMPMLGTACMYTMFSTSKIGYLFRQLGTVLGLCWTCDAYLGIFCRVAW